MTAQELLTEHIRREKNLQVTAQELLTERGEKKIKLQCRVTFVEKKI